MSSIKGEMWWGDRNKFSPLIMAADCGLQCEHLKLLPCVRHSHLHPHLSLSLVSVFLSPFLTAFLFPTFCVWLDLQISCDRKVDYLFLPVEKSTCPTHRIREKSDKHSNEQFRVKAAHVKGVNLFTLISNQGIIICFNAKKICFENRNWEHSVKDRHIFAIGERHKSGSSAEWNGKVAEAGFPYRYKVSRMDRFQYVGDLE